MKKIAIVVLTLLLASCVTQTPTDSDNPTDTNLDSPYFHTYTFITPKSDSNMYGFGVQIPDGFKISTEVYEKTGSLFVASPDQKNTFSLVAIKSYPHNDALSFIENDVISKSKETSFGQVATEKPWMTPFPGEEDITHCEASFASVEYQTNIQDVDFAGQIMVNWFDAIQKTSGSVGFVLSIQSPRQDWPKMKPVFEFMRQSLVWLPSGSDMQSKILRLTDNKKKLDEVAYEEFDYKMLQLSNGTPHGPGWETLFAKWAIGYDNETDKYYLVANLQTPSGLLPNPARPGMTLERNLPKKLFSYVLETTKPLKVGK
jgi:hypothetical protein